MPGFASKILPEIEPKNISGVKPTNETIPIVVPVMFFGVLISFTRAK